MRQVMKFTMQIAHSRRRADFLFHNGAYRPQVVESAKLYNRNKKVDKRDIDTKW